MIYTLKIKLAHNFCASDNWECSIEISENCNLNDFHFFIQDLLSFDNDHMYEFYLANTLQGQPIAKFRCDDIIIEKMQLKHFLLQAKGKKAFYLFDYGDHWLFQISNSRKKTFQEITGIEYPRVISEVGEKPEQYSDWEDDE